MSLKKSYLSPKCQPALRLTRHTRTMQPCLWESFASSGNEEGGWGAGLPGLASAQETFNTMLRTQLFGNTNLKQLYCKNERVPGPAYHTLRAVVPTLLLSPRLGQQAEIKCLSHKQSRINEVKHFKRFKHFQQDLSCWDVFLCFVFR